MSLCYTNGHYYLISSSELGRQRPGSDNTVDPSVWCFHSILSVSSSSYVTIGTRWATWPHFLWTPIWTLGFNVPHRGWLRSTRKQPWLQGDETLQHNAFQAWSNVKLGRIFVKRLTLTFFKLQMLCTMRRRIKRVLNWGQLASRKRWPKKWTV